IINPYDVEDVYLSTKYILHLAQTRGLWIRHLFAVTHTPSKATHTIAVIDDQRHICDCMMLSNLGMPCRHFFAVLRRVPATLFHIGLIRARWLKNPALDMSTLAPVSLNHVVPEARLQLPAEQLSTALSNPLDDSRPTPAPPTTTIGARVVFHEAQAALKPLMSRVRTQEQLDRLVQALNTL
ncbi:hypothetical protein EXIGLDRAFT_589923, partial [Exidia glandulosa HHB12029]